MFNRLVKTILAITSLSPVLLTFWYKYFSDRWHIEDGVIYLILLLILIIVVLLLLNLANKKLEKLSVKIESVQNADNEVISYIFAYLLPLIGFDLKFLVFILILFLFIVYTTNIYHFNPILGLFGYHYYSITIENGTTFILISKKTLMNAKQINKVVQLDDYTLLEI
ncbi:MAG: hypothetical protein WHV63_07910 [Ignavibacteria bacterium]